MHPLRYTWGGGAEPCLSLRGSTHLLSRPWRPEEGAEVGTMPPGRLAAAIPAWY